MAAAIGGTVYFYGDQIKEYAFNTLKEKINKEITFGKTTFAGLKHFPYVGLDIDNLYSPGFTKTDTLLFAPEVSLSFNLISILRGSIEIKKIELADAIVFLERDKTGKTNFELTKGDNKTQTSPSLAFDKLKLVNVLFNYSDKKTNTIVAVKFDDMVMKGLLKNDIIDINAGGKAVINSIYANNVQWVNEKTNTTVLAHIRYNQIEKSIHFENSEIILNETPVIIDGNIIALNNYNQYQLRFQSNNAKLNKAILLIPNHLSSPFSKYKANGKAEIICTISGSDAKGEGLVTELCFHSKDAKIFIENKNTTADFKNINGCYTWNPNSKDELLNIKSYTVILDNETLSGSIEIEDFNNPYIKLTANGNLNLETANRFLSIDTLNAAKGNLILNMSFEGNFKKAKTYKSNGSVELENVNLSFINNPLKLNSFNGVFNLKDNDIEVKDFSGNLNKSDVLINGLVTNLYDYLFLGDKHLQIDAKLSSNYLDLNGIWNSNTKNNDTTFILEFSDGLDVQLALNLNEFYFKKFEAKNLLGIVQLKKQVLSTNELSMDAMDGSAIIKGSIDASNNYVTILSKSTVKKLDIHKLFYQVGDFGQDVIVYQNLKGLVTANIVFNSVWSKTLDAELDKVYVQSDFVIENGELNNFEPMLALSKYVKGTDLEHIAFSELTNSIEIKNQKIYFPLMEIKSSALDIIGTGTHTFNNEIDYKIQLLVSQLLGKKVKEQNTEFGEIEDDGLGRSKLFLTMKGTVDDPHFAIDKKAIGNKIAQEIKAEKAELRKLLHTEFGKDKNNQVKDSKSNEEKNSNAKGFTIDEEEDFEIIDE